VDVLPALHNASSVFPTPVKRTKIVIREGPAERLLSDERIESRNPNMFMNPSARIVGGEAWEKV
jgi:hypothetical protein